MTARTSDTRVTNIRLETRILGAMHHPKSINLPEKVKIIGDIRESACMPSDPNNGNVIISNPNETHSTTHLTDVSQLFQPKTTIKCPKIVRFAALRVAKHFRVLRCLSFCLCGFLTNDQLASVFFPFRNFCMRSS